jgi:methionine-rich copper-binding protein CopC
MKNIRHTSAFFVALSLAISGNAFAHAHLESSEPAKDASVNSLPSAVTLHFSEELESSMSKLEVKNLDTGKIVSTGKPAYANGDKSALQISIKDPATVTKKSRFEVSWKAVSKDSHKMPGKYEFTFDPAKTP